jgi:UTP--glucose-1-phosphate uridylyltransferase
MMSQIKKAVIPAAGLGTRFLPATKTVPKEMLTIFDAPIIFYVVEEAIRAGIEDIILIQGRGKTAIEDFFDCSYELEAKLQADGKLNLLERLLHIRSMANIISVRQKQPLGLGHAILCAEKIIGNDPFAVLLGDEIMLPKISLPDSTKPSPQAMEQLVQIFSNLQSPVVSVMAVERSQVSKYGVLDVELQGPDGLLKARGFVEKPSPERAPSNWAIPGRYILTAEIFKFLKTARIGLNGEVQLTDSMSALAEQGPFWAAPLLCERYDAGDKLGYLMANVEVALRSKEVGPEFCNYLRQKAKEL